MRSGTGSRRTPASSARTACSSSTAPATGRDTRPGAGPECGSPSDGTSPESSKSAPDSRSSSRSPPTGAPWWQRPPRRTRSGSSHWTASRNTRRRWRGRRPGRAPRNAPPPGRSCSRDRHPRNGCATCGRTGWYATPPCPTPHGPVSSACPTTCCGGPCRKTSVRALSDPESEEQRGGRLQEPRAVQAPGGHRLAAHVPHQLPYAVRAPESSPHTGTPGPNLRSRSKGQ